LNIHLLGDVTIDGTGQMVLFRATTIDADNGGVLTNGAGHTIGGGDNTNLNVSIVNNGLIGTGGTGQLSLSGPTVTNNGTLSAGNSSVMQQSGDSTLTNYDAATQTLTGGVYEANDNGRLNLNIGPVVINAASVTLAGAAPHFDAINSIRENRGVFEVNGGAKFSTATSTADEQFVAGDALSNFHVLTVGSNSSINVNGNYTQGSVATLNIEIGSDNPTSGFAQLNVSGNARLAGRLNVTLVNGFKPGANQKFQIINTAGRTGTFSEVHGASVTYTSTGVIIHPNGAPIPPAGQLLNISTRIRVLTGDKALIGGFIVTGSVPKKVIIRALGPSLSESGVTGALQDPMLELFAGNTSLAKNDNWKQNQQAEIKATGVAPTKDAEAAIVRTLAPGSYTAIVRGKNGTGIGLIEVYDLSAAADAKLANISSRGFVDTGENALIGGFIAGGKGPGATDTTVVVRVLGPSLKNSGVSDPLSDPMLQLVNANGTTVRSNDSWKSDQEAELEAIGIQPSNDVEPALAVTLSAGNYTAIVRGKDNGTGVALVEIYNVQ
jgi:hypothetical protein